MQHNILLVLLLSFGIELYSQVNQKTIDHVPMANTNQISDNNTSSAMGGDEFLWYNDFSDTTNVTTESANTYGDWKWSTNSPGGQWSENAGIIQSATPENGFMLMEADFYNTSPQNGVPDGEVGENQLSASFTIGPIDLSASPTEQLVLQFYSNYRICCYNPPTTNNDMNVYISTDGGETFNDLEYIEGDSFDTNVEKETLSQIPLGNFSPNTQDVYFKFEWIGTHYFWMIDDVSVIQRPAYDLKMQSSWLTMADPEYIEYYSIPESQMPEEMLIGAEIYNYGYEDDLGVIFSGNINSTSAGNSIEVPVIQSDSTELIETNYFDVSMLTVGEYSFTANIESSEDPDDDPTPEDNTLTREFVVSETVYAIDGLYESSEWTGTGWPGGDDTSDGVRFANYFDIKSSAVLSSITIDLNTASHPTSLGTFQTQAGGEVIAYVCDTTGILNPNVETFNMLIPNTNWGGQVYWTSQFTLVNQAHVNWGHIVIDVPELQLNPNAYYIVVEFYSNQLASDILINDDTSVAQPWFASLMFYPSDQTWYSNPNAASIRIGLDGNQNLSEGGVSGVNFFPNPSKDFVEISSNQQLYGECDIKIYNMLGKMVLNETYSNFGNKQILNLEHLQSGSYIIELENNQETKQQKLIIE